MGAVEQLVSSLKILFSIFAFFLFNFGQSASGDATCFGSKYSTEVRVLSARLLFIRKRSVKVATTESTTHVYMDRRLVRDACRMFESSIPDYLWGYGADG